MLKAKIRQSIIFVVTLASILGLFVLLVKALPSGLALYYVSVATNLHKADLAAALKDLNEALSLNPRYGEAYYLRGTIWVQRSDWDDAIADFSSAISNGYTSPAVYQQRAFIFHINGNLRQAQRDYESYLSVVPNDPLSLGNMADIKLREGDFAGVLSLCNKALEKDPNCLAARANRATYHLNAHKPNLALGDINIAISNRKGTPLNTELLYLTRAMAYRQMGDLNSSKANIQTARELVPQQTGYMRWKAEKLEREFLHVTRRARFVLCDNLPAKQSGEMADFVDRLLNYFNSHLYQTKPDPEFHVFIFDSEKRYARQLKEMGWAQTSLYGNFDPHWDALFTTDDTGLGTIAHELTHKVLCDIPFMDNWAKEGIPALFEKIYGYPSNETYHLLLGCQNPWRIKALGKNLTSLRLAEVLAQQNPARSECEERLAAVFLYKHGLLKKYIDLSDSGATGEYATVFESTFGKSAGELEPEWHEYLEDIRRNAQNIATLPTSTILADEKSFNDFMREHARALPVESKR